MCHSTGAFECFHLSTYPSIRDSARCFYAILCSGAGGPRGYVQKHAHLRAVQAQAEELMAEQRASSEEHSHSVYWTGTAMFCRWHLPATISRSRS